MVNGSGLARWLGAWVLVLAGAAHAHGIDALAMFRTGVFSQSADATASENGAFLASLAFVDDADLYTTGTLTLPDGSPRLLTQGPTGLVFSYQTELLASRAALNLAYPSGSYGTRLVNEVNSDSIESSMPYAGDLYPSSVPFLAGDSYSRLQGLDAGASIRLNLNPMLNTGQTPAESWIFFSIFGGSGTAVFSQAFLPGDTTQIDLPAGTLQAGQSYLFDLVYSNRLFTEPPAPFEPAGTLGFDLRTQGSFSTAVPVPEPAAAALLALGLAGLAVRSRRRHPAR